MNRKYKGAGCGCGGTPMLAQNGGQNIGNNETLNNTNQGNNTNQANNENTGNNGGIMNMVKSFFGGEAMGVSGVSGVSSNSMTRTSTRRRGRGTASVSSNGTVPEGMTRRRGRQAVSIPANEIKFKNGSTLEGQVANMQQNLNSITGKKKKMRGGQNNLASLHNKVNQIANEVHNIKESNASMNNTNVGLFGGNRPMANIFLENKKNGGGIFDNIGNLFGVGNTNTQQPMPASVNENTQIEPINTTVQEQPVVATNANLPDPSAVVNKPNVVPSNTAVQPTGGNESSFMNSLFGGRYKPTKRNLKYLKRYKQGKSIGYTMRSSLKAKGLIKRANGTRRVSKKYRG
jgi:hypothetical protein